MNSLLDILVESLETDIISYGELKEIIATHSNKELLDFVGFALQHDIEIGTAVDSNGSYVKFIAWSGSINSRIERALLTIEESQEFDKDFSFWLCLRKNVDATEH
ncbi:MAG: hypothetical protein AAF333_09565 [Planctomycetota bacterium]